MPDVRIHTAVTTTHAGRHAWTSVWGATMAISINFSLDRLCSGGGHADVRAVVDSEFTKILSDLDTATLRSPLSREERETLATLLIRAKLAGLTPVQARNVMQAGFTVTIAWR